MRVRVFAARVGRTVNAAYSPAQLDVPEVLLVGDPRLRVRAQEVDLLQDQDFAVESSQLHRRLDQFRAEHGFGRAIAAPQIGVSKRFIALNLNDEVTTMVNPEVTWTSKDRFALWDDCMSFPDLLVRVSRNRSVSVRFTDATGVQQHWERLPADLSELLQHEIDHLDGVLALDRADGPNAVVERRVFERDRDYFLAMAD